MVGINALIQGKNLLSEGLSPAEFQGNWTKDTSAKTQIFLKLLPAVKPFVPLSDTEQGDRHTGLN